MRPELKDIVIPEAAASANAAAGSAVSAAVAYAAVAPAAAASAVVPAAVAAAVPFDKLPYVVHTAAVVPLKTADSEIVKR